EADGVVASVVAQVPDAVPVGLDEGASGGVAGVAVGVGGVAFGPPADQVGVWVAAGVGGKVDEELVDAEEVVLLGAADDAAGSFDAAARWAQAEVVRVVVGAGVHV